VFNYNTTNNQLTVTGNFSGIQDNAGFGIRQMAATMNNPWTMDEPENLEWQFRVMTGGTPNFISPSDTTWYRLNNNTQTHILSTPLLSSSPNPRDIQVRFRDSLGNTSSWSSSIGRFTFNTATLAPVATWEAAYNESSNTIDLWWTQPSGANSVELWVNGVLRESVNGNVLQANPRRITGVPRIDTSGVRDGRSVSNVIGYNIELVAVYGHGRAEREYSGDGELKCTPA
jgi:hypothetical protein